MVIFYSYVSLPEGIAHCCKHECEVYVNIVWGWTWVQFLRGIAFSSPGEHV